MSRKMVYVLNSVKTFQENGLYIENVDDYVKKNFKEYRDNLETLLTLEPILYKKNEYKKEEKITFPIFLKDAYCLMNHIYQLSFENRNKILKIPPKQQGKGIYIGSASQLLGGQIYKGLSYDTLTYEQQQRADACIRIGSALYGILHLTDSIHSYRLDYTVSLSKILMNEEKIKKIGSLYEYWASKLQPYFDELLAEFSYIINLSSEEYAKQWLSFVPKGRCITIDFFEKKEGSYVKTSAFSKYARGRFCHQCLIQNISTIEELKKITFDNYVYDAFQSSEFYYVFSR